MKVDILEGAEQIRELAPSLGSSDLLPAASLASDPYYLAAGFEGRDPCAVVAREGDRPVAYLPFLVRRSTYPLRVGPVRLGSLPYRQLRILGSRGPSPDRAGILARMCEHLAIFALGRYHVASASEIDEGDPLAAHIAERFGLGGARVEMRRFDSFRVDLRGAFDAYLNRRMSSKTRNTIRRKVRAFAKESGGEDRFEICTTPEHVGPFLERAEAIARRTYQWRRGLHVATESPESSRRLKHLASRGLWRGYLLSMGATPVAYCQGTVYGGKYDYEIPGFDERFARLSPGLVLLHRLLDDLFISKIAEHLDFGAGPGEYKRMFATSNPRVVYLSLYPRRAYSRMLGDLDGFCRSLTIIGHSCASRLGIWRSPIERVAESN